MAAENANWMDIEGQTTGGLNVQFYRGTKRDVFGSIAAGYPIDVGVDYVKVSHAGEKDNTIMLMSELTPKQRQDWREQMTAYKEGRTQVANGTPMDLLFPGNPEIVSTLKANNVHTIEQLANYPDSSSMQFAPTWKAKAIQFIDGKKDNRFPALEQRAKEAEAQLAAMKAQLDQLIAAKQAPAIEDEVEIANIEPVKRGPGRLPKPLED